MGPRPPAATKTTGARSPRRPPGRALSTRSCAGMRWGDTAMRRSGAFSARLTHL